MFGRVSGQMGRKKIIQNASFLDYTITRMQELGKARGGYCLSKEYVNEDTDLTWMCSAGHTWTAPPKTIRKGKWCAACKASKK